MVRQNRRTQVSGWLAATAAASVLVAGMASSASASGTESSPAAAESASGTAVAAPVGGATAVAELGLRLNDVARSNGLSAEALRHMLLSDSTVRVSPTGRLFYVDAAAPAAAGVVAPAAPFPYAQTFLLNSRPGSNRTILLDFDGFTMASGNYWGNTGTVGGWDADGNTAAFGTAEQDVIQSIWQRVSEDYAMFDVNVTTQDPGTAAIDRTSSSDSVYGTRAVFTSDAAVWAARCNSGCGGIAYLSVFSVSGVHERYQPAFVFPSGLGPNNDKFMAEAASHEVGHNLGLNHDGNSAQGYDTGHDPWAPIMGVGYYQPIVQWSKGEYANSNNTEDDFVVMQNNGLVLRSDDHGNSTATATVLGGTNTFGSSGVISTRTDLDLFSISHGCTGDITVSVTPAPKSPNLDAQVRILNSAGAQVAIGDPTATRSDFDIASGLNASATATAAGAGTYYVEVDGVGLGTGITGYTDYASLGTYTVSGTKCPAPVGGATCHGLSVTVDLSLGQVPTEGDDVILGTSSGNSINGLAGNDTICGGGGGDSLTGGAGNDLLDGEAGNDSLNPGIGDDTVIGGAGTDTVTYSGTPSAVTVSLAITTAQASGGSGSDTISTVERLTGSSYNDTLTGDSGANIVTGGSGNDALSGGAGTDTCAGGSGTDTADATCETLSSVP